MALALPQPWQPSILTGKAINYVTSGRILSAICMRQFVIVAERLSDGSTAGKLLFLIATSFAQKFIDVFFRNSGQSLWIGMPGKFHRCHAESIC
ncbi:MAG: hypothetical protein LBI39_03700 [Puniceicoccales bacterium]|nr:hypothetical protein [Puniceicoccales bacterium]